MPALRRIESLFFGGMRGEVWIEPGKPPSQARGSLLTLPTSSLFYALRWGVVSSARCCDVGVIGP